MLSILRLEMRLCPFTGMVAAAEHFIFACVVIATSAPEAEAALWRIPAYHFYRSLMLFVAGLVAGLLAKQIVRQVEGSLHTVLERDRAVRSSVNTSLLRSPRSCLNNRSNWPANCATSA